MGTRKGPTVRSEGPKALHPMNFPDWPQDSLPGGEAAGSRIKIEQDGMIEKKERPELERSRRWDRARQCQKAE